MSRLCLSVCAGSGSVDTDTACSAERFSGKAGAASGFGSDDEF